MAPDLVSDGKTLPAGLGSIEGRALHCSGLDLPPTFLNSLAKLFAFKSCLHSRPNQSLPGFRTLAAPLSLVPLQLSPHLTIRLRRNIFMIESVTRFLHRADLSQATTSLTLPTVEHLHCAPS